MDYRCGNVAATYTQQLSKHMFRCTLEDRGTTSHGRSIICCLCITSLLLTTFRQFKFALPACQPARPPARLSARMLVTRSRHRPGIVQRMRSR